MDKREPPRRFTDQQRVPMHAMALEQQHKVRLVPTQTQLGNIRHKVARVYQHGSS